MRRVSSRQRLVSWDAFEANANQSDGHSSGDEDYWYPPSAPQPMPQQDQHQNATNDDKCIYNNNSRKRERRDCKPHPQLGLTMNATTAALALVWDTTPVIPAFDWELCRPLQLGLDDLPQDLHMNILSFLEVESIRRIMAVSKKYRNLVLSDEAETFWTERLRSAWQILPQGEGDVSLVDTLNIPTAAGIFFKHKVNIPVLLSMTPKNLPTKVDESLLGACRPNRRMLYSNLYTSHNRLRRDELLAYDEDDRRVIRYSGLVGSGDRCIRSDHPLPRPERKHHFKNLIMESQHPSLFELLCRGSKALRGMCVSAWRPFVAPYVERDQSIQVTPRMVAYFEVSILERDDEDDEDDTSNSTSRDCVAVGVATASFHCQTRMPGWDSQSFGYHGDDGGIFHASGGMVERFGPCFGAGDTVGCGIDYVARGIFFTLNGKFLGYGWKSIDIEFLENHLYGVVGIDTNNPVTLNYGDKPFQFDLSAFSQKHDKLIVPYYQWTESDPLLDDLPSYPEV